MPKAYSYVRFSTPEQSKGDSSRRQMEEARRYATQYGLELQETTYADLGLSAFHGRNAEVGKLGEFLEAVRGGLIERGSFLLVESLDRISRQSARKAFKALEAIIDEDITVVTLSDRRTYSVDTLESDPTSLMISLLVFIRANEESVLKSRRLKAVNKAKRERVALEDHPSKPFTRRLPAWLQWNEEVKRFELIEDRAEVVRGIFRDADQGSGQLTIARRLNEAGVKPFGEATHWHRSYIIKILRNPAVVGTFIPHTRDMKDGKRTRGSLKPLNTAIGPPSLIVRYLSVYQRGSRPGRRGVAMRERRLIRL